MRLALLFSGQGQQSLAHFQRLREQVSRGGDDSASAALAVPLADALGNTWTRDAPALPELQANQMAQPFIFALQVCAWQALSRRLPRPVCAAGYSLGEMAACSAAGLFTASEGIALCAERARAMDACVEQPAGLLAVIGLPAQRVEEIAGRCGAAVAIRNGPDHLVMGGLATALDAAEPLALQAGASRVVRLGVTTPSHTPLLAGASVRMAELLAPCHDRRLAFPVLAAIDGRALRTGGAAVDALARQLSTPLDWAACMEAVAEMKPDVVLEIGPGSALARMWAERDDGVPVRACDEFRSVDGIVAWVERAGGG